MKFLHVLISHELFSVITEEFFEMFPLLSASWMDRLQHLIEKKVLFECGKFEICLHKLRCPLTTEQLP